MAYRQQCLEQSIRIAEKGHSLDILCVPKDRSWPRNILQPFVVFWKTVTRVPLAGRDSSKRWPAGAKTYPPASNGSLTPSISVTQLPDIT